MQIKSSLFSIAALSAVWTAQAVPLVWNGAGGGNGTEWDRKSNWNPNSATGGPTTSDDLTFQTITFSTAITNPSGTANAASIAFATASTSAYTFSLGTLNLGSGTTFSIANDSSQVQSFAAATTIAAGGNQTWNANSAGLSFGGAVNLGNFNLVVGGANNVDVSGAIGSTGGSLTKNGNGALNLTGANTYTGGTTIDGGAVNVSGAGTLGAVAGSIGLSGGVLDIANNLSSSGTFNFGGGALSVNDAASARNISFGSLNLSGPASINLTQGNVNNSSVTFASASYTSGLLTINDWEGPTYDPNVLNSGGVKDKVFVTAQPDSSFLGAVQFFGANGAYPQGGRWESTTGELVPVPEPHEYAAIFALGLVGFAAYRRRASARA